MEFIFLFVLALLYWPVLALCLSLLTSLGKWLVRS